MHEGDEVGLASVVVGAMAALFVLLAFVMEPRGASPPSRALPITVTSIPLGAKVVLDGEGLGETPVLNHPMPEGEHELIVLSHDRIADRTIIVGEDQPREYVWDNTRKVWLDQAP